ncbi:transcriptional regulator [Neisseria sp. HSC-16F19]|nr:FMN-binding negative transcriptional regulator [Neisseria sp. HSC-16F19]MCP2041541.1 transcriptional regulator [Neisseria sp. HSC-16F19]
MYTPSKFKQTGMAELRQFAAAHPLATIVLHTSDGVDAAHIPLFWQDKGTEYGVLRGHFARANPIWKSRLPEQEALVIFQDAGHYISPNWYPSKAQHHKEVPTWNYQAVHLRGPLNIVEGEAAMLGLLADLTAQHEALQPQPWSLADAPADYLSALCRAIVCFEITVNSVEGKYKLSQNQSAANRAGVVAGLNAANNGAAARMAALVTQFGPQDTEKQA